MKQAIVAPPHFDMICVLVLEVLLAQKLVGKIVKGLREVVWVKRGR
jgi:hypothetical protein